MLAKTFGSAVHGVDARTILWRAYPADRAPWVDERESAAELKVALAAHGALGARDLSRVDFVVAEAPPSGSDTARGHPWPVAVSEPPSDRRPHTVPVPHGAIDGPWPCQNGSCRSAVPRGAQAGSSTTTGITRVVLVS